MSRRLILLLLLLPAGLPAATITVTNADGEPLPLVMVTRTVRGGDIADTSDNGYPQPGLVNRASPQHTRFTNADGQTAFEAVAVDGERRFRVRAQGYSDAVVTAATDDVELDVALERLTDSREIAESKPSNLWLSQLDFSWADDPALYREHFLRHCGFCHQQASVFMRTSRTEEQWAETIDRMQMYGAMASEDLVDDLPAGMVGAFRDLIQQHASLPDLEAWQPHLTSTTITEWPIGDGFSQMHDFILHPNGKVYVGDNLMDRIYAFDPATGEYEVFKVPHDEGAQHGGILGNRMAAYPKTDNYMGVHSFAISPVDGHIFLTPSMQQELVEFDPDSGAFRRHRMEEGFYPHTIRTDSEDRVWFTLALSSQVAMFDRATEEFTVFDIPARGMMEWAALKVIKFRLGNGFVNSRPGLDWETTGFPMPYGIDVSPVDGRVWIARLYADDIAVIDPDSEEVTVIETPFHGPRRLRIDAGGDIWIVAFSDGLLARYDPVAAEFELFELPVVSETPYALNVDRERGVVWVNGNQSDTIMSFHIQTETWRTYPLPRRRTFTRDIEIADDGSVYTSNSHFPSWMIEGGQPTLIHVDPGLPADPIEAEGASLYVQHCDACHSLPDIKAPELATLKQMPFSRVARSLEFGMMMQQAAHLSSGERYAIARYLGSANTQARDEWIAGQMCEDTTGWSVAAGPEDNWGFGLGNTRSIAAGVRIAPSNVNELQLGWALAIPGATEMRSQPVAANGALFVATANGNVFALDQASGCVRWRFSANSAVRSSLNLDTTSDGKPTLFFADDLGTVYAVNANNGRMRWSSSQRWFAVSVISGSLAFHNDVLYVPVSSFETALAGVDAYPCCRSHGGVAAINAVTGELLWRYETTPHAMKVGTTRAGTDTWGPSGASVWTTPAIDAERGRIYIGTGQNMSPPATHTSDAVIALDMATGKEAWVYQALAGDVWNVACHLGRANCPDPAGPDFDFGGGIALATDARGRDIIVAGQKSGHVHALDPDRAGAVIWQQRLSQGTSNGGIHWGVAASDDTVWVTVSDPPRQRDGYVPRPGIHALDLANGEIRWSQLVERGCAFDPAASPRVGLIAMQEAAPEDLWPDCSYYYGHSAAPLQANDVLYAGALDGKLRLLDAATGEVLRTIETAREFETINGVPGHGGAIDLSGVVVDGDRLFVYSGYGMFGQMPGNVLLAFELKP